jgi:uncharacterized membrane protein
LKASSRVSPALAVFLVAGLAGLAISLYLTVAHYSNAALACANSGVVNCDLVTRSSYGLVPGTSIPVSLTGVVWFVVALALAFVAHSARGADRARIANAVWGSLGLVTVFYLVFAEVRLGHLCEWCTAVHALVVGWFLLALMELTATSEQRFS